MAVPPRRCVILESPYSGDIQKNVTYARRCIKDSLDRNEAPLASHLLYTQPGILDDSQPSDRLAGIEAGLAWYPVTAASVVYTDLGISSGMQVGIQRAQQHGIPIEYRTILP
jgi:hypothetical protein